MAIRKHKQLMPVKILDNKVLCEGVHYLSMSKPFNFAAGQVIALALKKEDEPRLYSIASGEDKATLSILFDIKYDGELTPPLSRVKSGDKVYISEPFGKFLCQSTPATWIATGTGIAPFISFLESGKKDNVTLLHGARTLNKFFFQDLFNEVLKNNYLRFCTTQSDEQVREGRLTSYLQNHTSLPTDNKYYLCGSPQMVIDVREILISKAVPFDNIIAEIYF